MNFIVRLGIFPYDIMVSAGQSDKELKKELKKYGLRLGKHGRLNKVNNMGKFLWYPEVNAGLIRMREIPETAQMHGSLSHEIFHAVDFVLRYAGIKLTDASDETYAYAIGYLTQEIYKKFYTFK